ncbi:unnamed protein product [Plasmodium vivax]|uniref:(malaria parasite P. vivax) hypothetical protein n=1 Tax=Plasmodium vivax TaxID=5855 RepID=A0A8S4HHT8_PLAVI|nr:unnamed protein product [Plasmodium vivax]
MPDEDPDINDLPTNKFYQRLDGENGIEVYYNDCSTVKSRYNDHSDHYKFCAIVVKNLKTLHNIPHDNIPDDLLCHYWNYWLYDRAINKFKITDEIQLKKNVIIRKGPQRAYVQYLKEFQKYPQYYLHHKLKMDPLLTLFLNRYLKPKLIQLQFLLS